MTRKPEIKKLPHGFALGYAPIGDFEQLAEDLENLSPNEINTIYEWSASKSALVSKDSKKAKQQYRDQLRGFFKSEV